MGGDNAPEVEVAGAVEAAKEFGIEVILVGDQAKIEEELSKHKTKNLPITIQHATQVVGMSEAPTDSYKYKKDSSLLVALKLVKEGKAGAMISAGNTGAVMANALFELGRIAGVQRPALSSFFPSVKGRALILDVGANADCKPKHLLQFAVMGNIYYKYILGVETPRIALLSIGEEDTKGNELIFEAARLIKKTDLNFVGNIEGKDIIGEKADIIVCDGFVGNIVLKFAESLGMNFFKILRKELEGTSIFISFGALLVKPVLKGIIKKTDYSEYGSAPLLGVNGQCYVSHGGSNIKAIKNAIKYANEATIHKINTHITTEIARIGNGNGNE
jgi:glycerol-3-phosphate acyltransferase PlsX